jgi:hypothetical protein
MLTGLRRAVAAGAIVSLVLAGQASATYLAEDPGNVDVAEARSTDGMSYAWLSRDNLGGWVMLRAGIGTYESIVCEDGSDGAIETDFSASGTPTTYAFGRQQSWARASGTIPGVYRTWNHCTGESTEQEMTWAVTLDLTGSRYTTTSSSKGTVKDPDGTVRVWTHRETMALATGSFTIDDASFTAQDAWITHEELAVRVR